MRARTEIGLRCAVVGTGLTFSFSGSESREAQAEAMLKTLE
jgi:hypothetical protein